MSDYTEEEQAEAETADEEAAAEGPSQSITREPAAPAGPFFPSGMSAPEAAMSGATANMSDDDKAKIEDMKAEYGFAASSTEPVAAEDDGETEPEPEPAP